MVAALLAIEDRRFYRHRGIDLMRVMGAAWADLRARRLVQGGSTITQQLVRLAALTPEHREIVDLVYVQDKSISEIAGLLHIPPSTVKTRMFYARKKLSELLAEQGIERGWP